MKRSWFRGFVQLAISLGMTAGLAGCGQMEDSGATESEPAALSVGAVGQGAPACGAAHDPAKDRDHRFHKRCERYQQKHPHRDGRDRNAHIATRALMDIQKMTTVEATTGAFDDINPPGRIESLRIDIARTGPRGRDGRTIIAKSQQGSGYVSTTIANLFHGQPMSIKAHVTGIDREADEVSVDDQVRYRPDLVVAGIDVPAAPAVGLPTSIAATVREAKGDEGATANCVLSVDGVAADRTNGIWVDAAGVVTCHFTTIFATAGAHKVAVDVLNVAPSDYDATNNHAEISVAAIPQFQFSGSVVDSVYAVEDIEDVLDASGAIAYHRDDTSNGHNQSVSVSGTWPTAVTFPLASLTANASSNGATWSLVALTGVAADAPDGSGMTCASGSDITGYNWVGICTTSDPAAPATQMSLSAFAGDVTYHSVGVCQTTSSFFDCANGYSWNSGSSPQAVTASHSIVGSLALALAVTDSAGVSLVASPTIAVAPYTTSSIVPRACQTLATGEQDCTSHSSVETGVSGSAQQ
ncbi:MAG: hypothetical protein JWM82_374 [Myxococcales bacterium]|nr:hypothetical protein [Myxococcales bacterium]